MLVPNSTIASKTWPSLQTLPRSWKRCSSVAPFKMRTLASKTRMPLMSACLFWRMRLNKNHPRVTWLFINGMNGSGLCWQLKVRSNANCSDLAFYLLFFSAEPLESKGHRNAALNLRLWHGDVAETIRKAAKAGQLNDWMINVAAGASRRLWEEACEAYALQLASNDDPIKAASYFLMLHKVVEAIDVLSKAKQFRLDWMTWWSKLEICNSMCPAGVP